MSEYGEGSPPPPYGGGNSEGQQPYGTPPPQPYGAPPPQQPQYGSPPQYGAPQQPYGAPPPQQPYGAPPPQYGAPQPPQYGAPAPPPPGYGATPPPYAAAPPPAYGAPYGAPGVEGMTPFGPAASMWRRLGARLIDGVIIGIPVGILALILGLGPSSPGRTLLQLVVGAAYEIALIATRGATLGKQAVGIRVVRETDGQVLGWGPAALRWLVPTAGLLACFVGIFVVYLSPFFDNTKRNQGWHDKVAKDFVVRA